MLKLMKYEILRREKLFITTLIVFICLELGVWLGMELGNGWYAMSVIMFVLLMVGGFAFPFIDAVVNYFSDFKRKNGYMLFLTPNNGYKILGAKMLIMLAELLVLALLIAAAVNIDYNIFLKQLPPSFLDGLNNSFSVLATALGVEKITLWTFSPIIITGILQYITNVTVALTAVTIAKTLLSSKDFNWLFALAFYIALYIVIQLINSLALAASGLVGDVINLASQREKMLPNVRKYLAVGMGMYTVLTSGLFLLSGMLLNKRTDL